MIKGLMFTGVCLLFIAGIVFTVQRVEGDGNGPERSDKFPRHMYGPDEHGVVCYGHSGNSISCVKVTDPTPSINPNQPQRGRKEPAHGTSTAPIT